MDGKTYSGGEPVLCALAKFYWYSQSNPGGHYDLDGKRGVSVNMVIEAADKEQAWELLMELSGQDYCPCCGSRWSEYPEELDEPPGSFEEHWSDLTQRSGRKEPVAVGYLHRMDGSVMPIKSHKRGW